MRATLLFFVFVFAFQFSQAQSYRLQNRNSIGWFAWQSSLRFHEKFSFHGDVQVRRNQLGKSWQQLLIRPSINWHLQTNTVFRFAYALADTWPYGDVPLQQFGKKFRENRLTESILFSHKISILSVSHRYMVEQRWIQTFSSSELKSSDGSVFVNRLRYLVRMQLPLAFWMQEKETLYASLGNEILLGFGKNVKENVFDQNRIYLQLGYQISPQTRIEGGFMNQTLELGREIDGKNVFQINSGFIFSITQNFDFRKSENP